MSRIDVIEGYPSERRAAPRLAAAHSQRQCRSAHLPHLAQSHRQRPTPVSIDDLIQLSGCSPPAVRIVLLELELAGRIERHGAAMISLI